MYSNKYTLGTVLVSENSFYNDMNGVDFFLELLMTRKFILKI